MSAVQIFIVLLIIFLVGTTFIYRKRLKGRKSHTKVGILSAPHDSNTESTTHNFDVKEKENEYGHSPEFLAKWYTRIKILWITYQILVLYPFSLELQIAPTFFAILSMFKWINFDVIDFIPVQCGSRVWNYADSMIFTGCIPIILCTLWAVIYWHKRIKRRKIFFSKHPNLCPAMYEANYRSDVLEEMRLSNSKRSKISPSPSLSRNENNLQEDIKNDKIKEDIELLDTKEKKSTNEIELGDRKILRSRSHSASPFRNVSGQSLQRTNPDAIQTLGSFEKMERKRLVNVIQGILFILFIIQPGVCTKALGAFECIDVDPTGDGVSTSYLRADLSINCSSNEYMRGYLAAIIMCILYLALFTIAVFVLLYQARNLIQNRAVAEDDEFDSFFAAELDYEDKICISGKCGEEQNENDVQRMRRNIDTAHYTTVLLKGMEGSSGGSKEYQAYQTARKKYEKKENPRSLGVGEFEFDITHYFYHSYKPKYWYWDLIEILRRLLMTAILGVIERGSVKQIMIAFFMAFAFFLIHQRMKPYLDEKTNNLAKFGHMQQMFTLFIAYCVRNRSLDPHNSSEAKDIIDSCLILFNMGVFIFVIWHAIGRIIFVQALHRYNIHIFDKFLTNSKKIDTVKLNDENDEESSLDKKEMTKVIFGPTWTEIFTSKDILNDVKSHFLYLRASIAATYTSILHERRNRDEILRRGSYLESSEEEESEIETESETEETFILSFKNCYTFVEDYFIYPPDNDIIYGDDEVQTIFAYDGLSDFYEELVHEVEAEYRDEILHELWIEEFILEIVINSLKELTPPPEKVLANILAGSIYHNEEDEEELETMKKDEEIKMIAFQEYSSTLSIEEREENAHMFLEDLATQIYAEEFIIELKKIAERGLNRKKAVTGQLLDPKNTSELADLISNMNNDIVFNTTSAIIETPRNKKLRVDKEKILANTQKRDEASSKQVEKEKLRTKAQEEKAATLELQKEERKKKRKETENALLIAKKKAKQEEKACKLEAKKATDEQKKRKELEKEASRIEARHKATKLAEDKAEIRLKAKEDTKAKIKFEAEEKVRLRIEKIAQKAKDEKVAIDLKSKATRKEERILRRQIKREARSARKALRKPTKLKDEYDLSDSDENSDNFNPKSDYHRRHSGSTELDEENYSSSDSSISESSDSSAYQDSMEIRKNEELRAKNKLLEYAQEQVKELGSARKIKKIEELELKKEESIEQEKVKALRLEQDIALQSEKKHYENMLNVIMKEKVERKELMNRVQAQYDKLHASHGTLKNVHEEKERASIKPKSEEAERSELKKKFTESETTLNLLKEKLDIVAASYGEKENEETSISERKQILEISIKERELEEKIFRKTKVDEERARIRKSIEEDKVLSLENRQRLEQEELVEKIKVIENNRIAVESALSPEERERKIKRERKRADLKTKQKANHQIRLQKQAKAEDERRKQLADSEQEKNGTDLVPNFSDLEHERIDQEKVFSVAIMADRKKIAQQKEQDRLKNDAAAHFVQNNLILKQAQEESKNKLQARLARKKTQQSSENVDSQMKLHEIQEHHMQSEDEKKLDMLKQEQELAGQKADLEKQQNEQGQKSNTKRRVEIVKRRKKVKKRFGK